MASLRATARLLCTLAGGSLAAVSRAHSPSPNFLAPPAGASLHGGDVVQVVWVMDTRGTRDVDEMELVLSLDGGATFPLRVSRGLEPVAQTVRWTVPNLPTSRARLALRQGRCRRHDSEEVTIVGPAFAISGNAGEPLERVFRVGDEWRTREALESREDPPLANLSAAQGDEFRGILPSDCNAERTEFSATSTLDERERVRLASTVQVKRAVDRFLLASTGPLRQ